MRSNRVLAGLLLLLGLTTVLRFVGIGWMLPQLPEQDDFVATHVHLGRTGEQYADRRLSFSQYPYLLAHSVHLLPGPQTDPAELARRNLAPGQLRASLDWFDRNEQPDFYLRGGEPVALVADQPARYDRWVADLPG